MVAEAEDGETLSEHSALVELVKWSFTRPSWQRDALRRLLLGASLSEDDFKQLTSICCDPATAFEPLSADHIATEDASTYPISLIRIEDPKGINALAPEQKLEFSKTGLNIVYGDNGSGKSGYVRILKHACRTRDRNTSILQDVEQTTPVAQSSRIHFTRGDVEDFFDWTPQAPGHPDLPAVSIFDSRSANVHVEKTNNVAYIPRPMQAMEALATACDEVKGRIDREIASLLAQTPTALRQPTLQRESAAGAFVHGLSSTSSVAQLELLANITSDEKNKLVRLESDLAQNPKALAERLASLRSQYLQYVCKLRTMLAATTSSAFAERDNLVRQLADKKEAARLASEALFGASPLPEIGQGAWRALWEAARRYSDTVAYPGKVFPALDAEEDRCVLCQRPLDGETIVRWTTFEDFIKGTARVQEQEADRAVAAFTQSAAGLKQGVTENRRGEALLKSGLEEAEIAKTIRRCGVALAWRLRALCRGAPEPKVVAALPEDQITAIDAALTERISKLSADFDSPEYQALVKECRELKDRESLALLTEDIKSEIVRQKKIAHLKKCAKEAAKNSITTKNKDLGDKLVTNALRGRFAREMAKMKLIRMPVELRKAKDANAVSYFQVCLVEKPGQPVGEVFSEGEHRGVALAAFLAELVTSRRYSGIVFDDPMSSLDHIHRKSVAARLVEEAQHRQVIVFTHDLTFLFDLRREAEAKEHTIFYQTVCRRQTRPGFVDNELPSKAKSAKQLAHSLRKELKAIKGEFDHWNETKRTLFCKGFIEQLRESWDQGIADFVFPVLRRFDNTIAGSTLYKLVVLTDADVSTVTSARSRLSEDLHAGAETINPAEVGFEDLKAEILKLETWLDDIAQRQSQAQKPGVSYA